MEVFDCIKSRRCVRKFLSKEVVWDKIATIIDAGRMAPSAGNLQNWKFIVVLDADKKNNVAEACLKQHWIAEAAAIIVMVGEPEKARRFYGERGASIYTAQNCAAAAENMLLEATALGLGSCWVGAFNEEAVRRTLGMPDDVTPSIIIPIGYSAEKPEEPAKFPLENVAYFQGWRSKIRDMPAYIDYHSIALQRNIAKGKEFAEKGGKTLMEKGKEIAQKISNKLKEKYKKHPAKEEFREVHK